MRKDKGSALSYWDIAEIPEKIKLSSQHITESVSSLNTEVLIQCLIDNGHGFGGMLVTGAHAVLFNVMMVYQHGG